MKAHLAIALYNEKRTRADGDSAATHRLAGTATRSPRLRHVLKCVIEYLLPETINRPVATNLQRMVKIYGDSRPWTVGAMDGAAANCRLDFIQQLIDAAPNGLSNGSVSPMRLSGSVGTCTSEDRMSYQEIPKFR
ncbi:hypothetical protein JG687_00014414 [Phytophthora cactorum]|uniref:Uncharacterized protein n=1 Tax=Phytophthora cactorum TaxID=29920 RepID=A0A329RI07_9STRA|nr:hypothetical protein PC111_g18081 [Phytophthora cactorum]KAG2966564.1 hypothetical protein PC118_g19093 [Phytophthora cactorum]KAG3028986.1 hypothetical protein PC119_g6840 [Phytophthora cactorum]KAG3137335.1 hypothetical protein C6341_g21036 [Phytophthora cactorum]KAG6950195.1 hypothetical protein JG687_00014414 [Phytophthora cactorum]